MAVSSKDKMTLFMSEALIKKLKYKALETSESVSSMARQFLSSWEQDLLGFANLDSLKSLPESSAIYFVIDRDMVHYMGKAENLRQRLLTHSKLNEFQSLGSPSIFWVSVSNDFLHNTENFCTDTASASETSPN